MSKTGVYMGNPNDPLGLRDGGREIVQTEVVGHREPRYPSEPKNRREIRRLVKPAGWIKP